MAVTARLSSIPVRTSRPYAVHVGRDALARVARELELRSGCAVVTDTNVRPLHRVRLTGLDGAPTLALEPGERAKTLEGLERVLDFLADADLDRRSCVVALGGGVVGDVAGLAASLYMRGIAVVHAPTTLLAQVDSSIGGKTAVNLRAAKNLAGTFHQPTAVYADPTVLATLPEDEYRSGLGEAVKTALLAGEDDLAFLENRAEGILGREPDALAELVRQCVRAKADLVSRDERERGVRAQLNLGHTFGHAIERAAGYGGVPHGIAVAVGLVMAAHASRSLGLLDELDLPDRLVRLLGRLGLEASVEALAATRGVRVTRAAFQDGLRHDKKGAAGRPRLVVPRAVGRIEWGVEAPSRYWDRLLASLPE